MVSSKLLFIHTSFQFSGKTSKFIEYFKQNKKEYDVSVLALEPFLKEEKRILNKMELDIGAYNIPVHNLADLKTNSLSYFVKKLQPDIVIMYDDAFLMNATITAICRNLKIPTLYIQHGFYPNSPVKKNIKFISFVEKILKYKIFISFYLRNTKLNLSKFISLSRKLIRMSFFNESVNPTIIIDDFHCDYAAVWDKSSLVTTIKSKGYNKNSTFIVGNPDGINFFSSNFNYSTNSKNILYVMQPLVELNIIERKFFIKWSQTLINILPSNKSLMIRPHPKTDMELLRLCFPNAEIVYDENIDLSFVIGHYSTYNEKTQYMVPTILVTFPETENYSTDIIFNNSKKVKANNNKTLLELLSQKNIDFNSELPQRFLMDFYKETTSIISEIINN